MNSKKRVTAVSLYLKDLKRKDISNVYDYKIAMIKFKDLSIKDRDFYEVNAKKLNDRNEPVIYTTQRDTLGRNLKELGDMDVRVKEWFNNARKFYNKLANMKNVMTKDFYVMKVSGAQFNRATEHEVSYSTSEICLIKFSFAEGIKKELTLFPDPLTVAAGYRQSLYEDLEESVGFKPDTFRNNQSVVYCLDEIRKFFDGDTDEPIFVPKNDQQYTVGMALYQLYREAGRVCPWIKSVQDWGSATRIYQLEFLVADVMQEQLCRQNTQDVDINVSLVLDYWNRIMTDIAPEWCERHRTYGLANQCCTNLLKKFIYITFVIMHPIAGDEMREVEQLVSPLFYRNLEMILPPDQKESEDTKNTTDIFRSDWNNYYEESDIESVINNLGGVTINGRGSSNAMNLQNANARRLEIGRGRGVLKSNMASKNTIPGRKIRLPNVVC